MKIQKKNGGVGGSGRGPSWGGQGGCERRIEVFGKINKRIGGGVFGLGVFGLGGGGQGGIERRIETFCENSKKKWGGRSWGGRNGRVRVDVNEELKFLGKLTKNNRGGGGGGGGVGRRRVRWGVGLVGGGVRVDVNAMLGVGGDVGYGGCEPRIEGIVQCTKGIVQY